MDEWTQKRQRNAGRAKPDVELRPVALKSRRPLLPEGCEVEARRPLEAVLAHTRGHESRDAVHAHARASVGNEVPRTGLEHEAKRIERAANGLRPFAVPGRETAAAPDRRCERRQMRGLVLAAEPASRVEVKEPHGPLGSLLELGRQCCQDLQARVREHPAKPELGRRADEQGFRLVARQTGEPGAVAACEPVAARRAAQRLDRHPRGGEGLRVALDRPLRHLELFGELCGGELPPGLQEQEERDQPARTHPAEYTRQKVAGLSCRVAA